jgi:hypothetical protein
VYRRHVDVDVLVGICVLVTIDSRDLASGGLRGDRVREDEPGSGQRSGVRGILFVAPLDQHAAHVEGEGRYEEERDKPTCEQDEDLTALVGAVAAGAANC